MAKKVNWLPSERVDVPDLDHGTHDYSLSLLGESYDRFIKDYYSRITSGFRVEIADQSTSPGTFTIHNGYAINQDGTPVHNGEDLTTSRSATLSTDATYYVEIEFVANESDIDNRAFWNPEFDNGVDPSGDERPDGREYGQNVSTRLTHDWQIVTPISTSGFSVSSSPGSLKIPVAIITRSGGVISAVKSTTAYKTTIVKAAASGDGSIRVADSALLPGSGTAQIDTGLGTQEDITFTSNDRHHGILTLSGTLSNNHSVGARVVETVGVGTAPQYLATRTDHTDPVGTSGGGDDDARPRFFQANEEAGYALSQDPEDTDPARGDSQIKTLKEQVDFLAAQIREMKFGAARAEDIGQADPPSSFSAEPRYFDFAGGLLPARANTVSVGDGSSSWGDFNSTQAGDAETAITNALSVLSNGGTLYIKKGTYDIDNTITISNSVKIVGDGPETKLRGTSTPAVFDINSTDVIIENLDIYSQGGVTTYILTSTSWVGGAIRDCRIDGFDSTSTENVLFDNVDFTLLNSDISVHGVFKYCTFRSCYVLFGGGQKGFELGAGTEDISITDCKFEQLGTEAATGVGIDLNIITRNASIVGCTFEDVDKGIAIQDSPNTSISNCAFVNPTLSRGRTGIEANGTDGLAISDCTFISFQSTDVATVSGIEVDIGVQDVSITGCKFEDIGTIGSHTSAYGIRAGETGAVQGLEIVGCAFRDIDADTNCVGIRANNSNSFGVSSCSFRNVATGSGVLSIWGAVRAEACNKVSVTGNQLFLLGNASVTTSINGAIRVGTDSGSSAQPDVSIHSNTMTHIDGGDDSQFGILVTRNNRNVSVCGNTIRPSGATMRGIGILTPATSATDVTNITINGNTLRSTMSSGIYCLFQSGVAWEEGKISITGNTVKDFTGNGIFVSGNSTTLITNTVTITGNTVETDDSTVYGIRLSSISRYSVTGNTVVLRNTSGTGSDFGIAIDGERGVVSGNIIDVFSEALSARGIAATLADYASVTGNFVNLGSANTGTTDGTGIELADNIYAIGNMVRLNGVGSGIAMTSTDPQQLTAVSAQDLSSEPPPYPTDASLASLSIDIGLNWRFA